MSKLSALKESKNIRDLGKLLGFKPSTLAYIIYQKSEESKYRHFEIPKKTGGTRNILSPCPELKNLQKKLAELLHECDEELIPLNQRLSTSNDTRERARKSISHGFKVGLSIATNAEMHIGQKLILNLDLDSFFPSINFGRVRGFFIKNKKFKLTPKIATIIAQIACHKNELPQGSPSSPIISNLICKNLDIKLALLAKKNKCIYTRYADDLTFSTYKRTFPKNIAYRANKNWKLGNKLISIIKISGFEINNKKTRVSYNTSRQTVTGLVVNKVVNTPPEYYRYARAMCHELFKSGELYSPQIKPNKQPKSSVIDTVKKFLMKLNPFSKKSSPITQSISIKKKALSIKQLEGMLNYIYHIKSYRNKFVNEIHGKETSKHGKKPLERHRHYSHAAHRKTIDGITKLYAKFLFFKNFYFIEKPVIYCEGKTDSTYLKCAIKQLKKDFPSLITEQNNKHQYKVSFFNNKKSTLDIMGFAEGTTGMTYLIHAYHRLISQYTCGGKQHPVIFLIDNDDGAKPVKSAIKELTKYKKEEKWADDFYSITDNLYVVFLPKTNNENIAIEDFFEPSVLTEELEGKKFNPKNTNSSDTNEYGKFLFSEYVVKAKQDSINFDNFKPILDRIISAIDDYNSKLTLI